MSFPDKILHAAVKADPLVVIVFCEGIILLKMSDNLTFWKDERFKTLSICSRNVL